MCRLFPIAFRLDRYVDSAKLLVSTSGGLGLVYGFIGFFDLWGYGFRVTVSVWGFNVQVFRVLGLLNLGLQP